MKRASGSGELYNSSNAVVGTQTTGVGGAHHFHRLTPGVYHEVSSRPPGDVFTTQDADNGFDATDLTPTARQV